MLKGNGLKIKTPVVASKLGHSLQIPKIVEMEGLIRKKIRRLPRTYFGVRLGNHVMTIDKTEVTS